MRPFFNTLPLIVSLLIVLQALSAELLAHSDRDICHRRAWSQPVANITQLAEFEILNPDHIHTAKVSIPPQPKYSELMAWSCSQNAIARAITLTTGTTLFENDKQYIAFAHTVPKAIGLYRDHRFDNNFIFNSSVVRQTHRVLNSFYLPALLQNVLAYASVNTGMPPIWLAQYMNFYKTELGLPNLHFQYWESDAFSETIDQMKTAIRSGHSIVGLVVFSSLRWHYLNIIGFHEDTNRVLIMDTDANVYIWSYEQLKCLMNTGYQSGILAPDEWLTYTLSTTINQVTPINYYNLLIVKLQH